MISSAQQLRPPDDPTDDPGETPSPYGRFQREGEDLPYKVEVWDETGQFVELVVAVSATPAIGYAAYYAAAQEYPGRVITLRHKSRIVSRWTAASH